MDKKQQKTLGIAGLLLALSVVFIMVQFAAADPTGATVTNVSTETAGTGSAGTRNDSRGTITTLILNATQQDQHWKGYVGNVTGVLTLDDASGFTIYDWSLSNVTITGEVYVSRASSPTFTAVSCANSTVISTEETFHNMTAGQADSISNTFSSTIHTSFFVGSTQISNSSCSSTFTYLNDTAQTPAENASFQEVLLQDTSANLIYTTIIENNLAGYDNENYDFQMIVGESNVKSSPTLYYFFTEIAS